MEQLLTAAAAVEASVTPLLLVETWKCIAEVHECFLELGFHGFAWQALSPGDADTYALPELLRPLILATPEALRGIEHHDIGRVLCVARALDSITRLNPHVARAVAATGGADTTSPTAVTALFNAMHGALTLHVGSVPDGTGLRLIPHCGQLELSLPHGGARGWVSPLLVRVVPQLEASKVYQVLVGVRELRPRVSIPDAVLSELAGKALSQASKAAAAVRFGPPNCRSSDAMCILCAAVHMLPPDERLHDVLNAALARALVDGATIRQMLRAAWAVAHVIALGRGECVPRNNAVRVVHKLTSCSPFPPSHYTLVRLPHAVRHSDIYLVMDFGCNGASTAMHG